MSNSQSKSNGSQIFIGLLSIIFLSAVFGALIWVGYKFLSSIDSGVSAAIIAAAATIAVSLISIVLAKVYESRQAVEREIRENKIPVYEEFLNFMSRVLHGEKVGKKPSDEEMVIFMIEFNQKMMVWGSDSVLSAWRDWRKTIVPSDESIDGAWRLAEMMHSYENVIYAIRKDLGHKNEGLKKGDLLRLFINDYDEFLGRH
jgi:hypothetical protein